MAKATHTNPIKTVLTICLGFCIVFLVTEIRGFLLTGLLIGLLGLISSFLAKQIDFLWGLLTKVLSYIVPNILLTSVFFFFLFPVALLSKLFGKKDPLLLKNPGKTTFVEVNKTFEPGSFEHTF